MQRNSYIVTRIAFIAVFIVTIPCSSGAQQQNSAVKNAYIITKMADKFHLQPRQLNDTFSKDVFNQLLRQTDEDKLIFTAEDIAALSRYASDIDDEIRNRQPTFLKAITNIYRNRAQAVDTMISNICRHPFDFSLPEKITAAEDTSYAAEKNLRLKIYKKLKSYVLSIILDEDEDGRLNTSGQKKYLDSLEPIARRKAEKAFKRPITLMLQSAAGIDGAMGDEYCKAIALCYDPHTEYFPVTEKEDFESELGDKTMTFGFTCKEDDDGSVIVESVAPGSPAFKSGQMHKGDKILSIQWQDKQPIDVSTAGLKQLYQAIAMSNHDKATLKIKKQDGIERSVILFKEKMENDNDDNKVKSFILKGSKAIGFISLPAFYKDWDNKKAGSRGCANDVAKEILKLKGDHIEGLIIDLRYNGGGSLQEAVELAGIFIDVGPVCMEKGRDAKIYTEKDFNHGTIYDGPLMIMVNGYTASAAEVVSGTLQDYHRAVIVGSPTYGKATAQIVLPMDTTITFDKDFTNEEPDSYFKVTVSELYRVTGNTAQAKGIQPDVILPDNFEGSERREADNPFVILPRPVGANKYFKPYDAININELKKLANNEMDSSPYFQRLKNYISPGQKYKKQEDESLQLSVVLAHQEENVAQNVDSAITKKIKPRYIVENNLFEQKQTVINDDLKELNDQWIKFLSYDPYLQICYNMILAMIH